MRRSRGFKGLQVGLIASIFAVLGVAEPQAEAKIPPKLRFIETSTEFARELVSQQGPQVQPLSNLWNEDSEVTVLLIPEDQIERISHESHHRTGRCGGFIDITDESSLGFGLNEKPAIAPQRYPLPALNGRRRLVARGVAEVQPENIENFVKLFSSTFKTRNARTPEGEQAPKWLAHQWKKMAEEFGRDDIQVETLLPPKNYNQENVRITIPGADPDMPIVILGGHLDSINWRDGSVAPGADDDASGISALTEAYRVMLEANLRPRATIQIFGYAAEELGLLGSRALAERYQSMGVKVRGVMQLDMVAYPGETRKVTFITDYVDRDLTLWTQQLYGTYVGGDIHQDRCGYACSDHASWTRYGFPAVMPFEAPTGEMNQRIHTTRDVWDERLDAEYAAKFAKLAYAFAAELSEAR